MIRTPVLSVVLCPLEASAAELSVQARLVDAIGQPIVGAHDITVSLFDGEDSNTQTFTTSFEQVALEDGYLGLRLDVPPAALRSASLLP